MIHPLCQAPMDFVVDLTSEVQLVSNMCKMYVVYDKHISLTLFLGSLLSSLGLLSWV